MLPVVWYLLVSYILFYFFLIFDVNFACSLILYTCIPHILYLLCAVHVLAHTHFMLHGLKGTFCFRCSHFMTMLSLGSAHLLPFACCSGMYYLAFIGILLVCHVFLVMNFVCSLWFTSMQPNIVSLVHSLCHLMTKPLQIPQA